MKNVDYVSGSELKPICPGKSEIRTYKVMSKNEMWLTDKRRSVCFLPYRSLLKHSAITTLVWIVLFFSKRSTFYLTLKRTLQSLSSKQVCSCLRSLGFAYTQRAALKSELRILKTLEYRLPRSPLLYSETLLKLVG